MMMRKAINYPFLKTYSKKLKTLLKTNQIAENPNKVKPIDQDRLTVIYQGLRDDKCRLVEMIAALKDRSPQRK